MADFALNAFITLFIVIDPVGVAPIFVSLTPQSTGAQRRRMALRGIAIAAAILFLFAGLGSSLLNALGVTLPAFRIAGGLLLFLLAVDMILARPSGLRATTGEEQQEALDHEDISVFPLAIPLIAGPGAMASIVLLMGRADGDPTIIVLLLCVLGGVLTLSLIGLLFAAQIAGLLGRTGTNVIARVLGIVLAALAVQYVLDGITASGVMG